MIGSVVYILVLLGFIKVVELVFTLLDKVKDNK
jgi:hypothetical protein